MYAVKFQEQKMTTPFGNVYTSTPFMRTQTDWQGKNVLLQVWTCDGQPELCLPLGYKQSKKQAEQWKVKE